MRFQFGAITLALATLLSALTGPASAADADNPVKKTPAKKAAPPASASPFFFVNDNRLTYAVLPEGRQITIKGPVQMQVFAFTHFDAWAYGTNTFNIFLSKSAKNDPAGPCPIVGQGCAGESYIRGSLRSTFGFNEVFGTKAFTWGILRNVSLEVGTDADTTNAYIGASARDVVAGVQFAFTLPYSGFLNIAPLYYQEWNHNSFLSPAYMAPGFTGLPDGNTHFRGTWDLEMNYYMDLGFLPESLQYFAVSGRAEIRGPKGTGAYGPYTIPVTNKTTAEFLSEPIRLTFDASKLAWGPRYSHFVDLWVAYRARFNRNGLNDSNPANPNCFSAGANNGSCSEQSVYSGVTVKF